MAVSSKVLFRLETLKEKALEAIDFHIAQKKIEVDSFEDEDALEERIKEWRTKQEERISDLFRQLGDDGIDNYRLARFKMDDLPKFDRYDRERAMRELRSLEAKKSEISAKASSLVPDEDGNISLTSTQMHQFFSL